MTNKIRFLILGATVILLILQHQVTEGKPSRNTRLIAGLGLDYPQVDETSNDIEEIEDRTVRRSAGSDTYYRTTYPPFPGDEDADWENIQTSKPPTVRPYITQTTETTFVNRSDNENDDKDDDVPFHRRVYPWLKHQWGHVSNYFRNQIG